VINCTVILADGTPLTPDTYENYNVSLDSESPDIPTEQGDNQHKHHQAAAQVHD